MNVETAESSSRVGAPALLYRKSLIDFPGFAYCDHFEILTFTYQNFSYE